MTTLAARLPPATQNGLEQAEHLAEELVPAGQFGQKSGDRERYTGDCQRLRQLLAQNLKLCERVFEPVWEAAGEVESLLESG